MDNVVHMPTWMFVLALALMLVLGIWLAKKAEDE